MLPLALLALAHPERDASPNSLLVECGEGMSRAFFQAAIDRASPDDINARDYSAQERTPLHCLVMHHDQRTLVRKLIEAGALLDAVDTDGRTPLNWAAAFCHRSSVQELLDHGADTAIKDNEGRLAADWAQEGGCPEVSALIFDAYRQKLKAAAAEKAKAKAERKAQREAEAAARQKAARDAAAGREL